MAADPERKDQLAALASLRIQRDGAPTPAKPSRIPWGWIVLAAVVGVGGTLAWKPARQMYADKTMPPPEMAAVTRVGGPELILTASGYVNADAVVDVGTTLTGRLRRLDVKKGDHVKRGQTLALIDDEEWQAQRVLAKANLDDARRTHDRAAALLKTGAGTPQEVDKTQAALEVAKASIQVVDVKIRQARIVSPIDGKVLDTLADPGEILTFMTGMTGAGQAAVVRLADLSKTVVEVDVNETDIGKLRIGQPAEIVLDAYPQHPYRGELHEIAQIADKAKATVQVKVRVAEPDENVRPNMNAKVVFRPTGADLSQRGQLVLPRRALLPGEPAVLLVRKNRVERRAIRTRPAEGDAIEVLEGLGEGDQVLTSQLGRWKDGAELPQPTKE